jgi:phosphatidylglycerol:prolipoprotein diacylglycerol transferase
MLAIGFLAGILLAARRAQRLGENPDYVYNLSVWAVLSSLIGSRIYYVVTHYDEFRAGETYSLLGRILVELKNMFWPIGSDGQVGISGLIYYGGLIAATAATILYLRANRLNLPKYLDILAPGIPLGEFFTRIGCFLNGCCFGHPTHSHFGVVFPEVSAAGSYYPETLIHPTQLYSSFAALAVMGLILWLERYKKFNGFSALLFFMLYGIDRLIVDFFRYYEPGMESNGISQNQIISLAIFGVSAAMMVVLQRRAGGEKKESGARSQEPGEEKA